MSFETTQELVPVSGGHIEITCCGELTSDEQTVICASHPIEALGPTTSALLATASGTAVVSVNPRGVGNSSKVEGQRDELVQVVDDLEAVRRHLGVKQWVFWGMSGGGWLGQLYAHRYPQSLAAIILESICACLRERAADPECVLSPRFPAWREALAAGGLLDLNSALTACTREQLEWVAGPGMGATLRRQGGPAVLVSPIALTENMRRTLPLLFELDTRPWLKLIAVPALVLCGTADPLLPIRHARALHEGLLDSEFVAIEGAGHVPVTELHVEVTTAVRAFLAKHRLHSASASSRTPFPA